MATVHTYKHNLGRDEYIPMSGGATRNVRNLFAVAVASWRPATAMIVAFTALALVVAFVLPPVYKAEVVLAPAEGDTSTVRGLASQLGDVAQLAGLNLSGDNTRAVSVATLKSRALVEGFIQENHLLPVLFSAEWDAAKGRWKRTDVVDQPTIWDAYRKFDKRIRVIDEDRRTGLVTLTIQWRDPVQAASWANELVSRTNAVLRAKAIDESERTIKYLQKQVDNASSIEVRQLLFRLIEAEMNKIAVANAREQYAFRVIDPAVVPRRRASPLRSLIVLAGFFLGAIASAALIFARAAPPAMNVPGEGVRSPGVHPGS
jgi:uncharacterized protein involved in exopolysaccharide biosynthesis